MNQSRFILDLVDVLNQPTNQPANSTRKYLSFAWMRVLARTVSSSLHLIAGDAADKGFPLNLRGLQAY